MRLYFLFPHPFAALDKITHFLDIFWPFEGPAVPDDGAEGPRLKLRSALVTAQHTEHDGPVPSLPPVSITQRSSSDVYGDDPQIPHEMLLTPCFRDLGAPHQQYR